MQAGLLFQGVIFFFLAQFGAGFIPLDGILQAS